MKGENLGGALVFFRYDEVTSYAMARLKADNFEAYRNKDPRVYRTSDEAELRRKLDDDRHRQLVTPGVAWWNHVHMFLAEQVGDDGTVARLKAENRASLDTIFAKLSTVMPGRDR